MSEVHGYGIRTYGERIAEVYDRFYGSHSQAAIDALKRLAGGGAALELGIGTGRIALPLREAGVAVSGIDASEAMVGKLRSKPGGGEIPVVIGDFADVEIEGEFSLVYVVFNTFFNLLTQDDQVRCFRNVSRHLAPGGVFVLETFIPDLGRFRGAQDVRLITQGDAEVRLDVSQVDTVLQVVTATHVTLTDDGARFYPLKLRYAWPSEMDLMARLSGLALRERWGGWNQAPFVETSGMHISIYGKELGNADAVPAREK